MSMLNVLSKRQEYILRRNELTDKLVNECDTLLHAEYIRLCEERDRIVRELNYENIKLDIWDQAREICLNIADEMEDTK